MQVLIFDERRVFDLLPMEECIPLMASVLETLARGDAVMPLRQVIALPGGARALASMPAYVGSPAAIGVKVITVFPDNHGTAVASHQGAVLLFEAEQGRLLAILDAGSITAIRTAAVSAVATDVLARPGARGLALLGAGVQAESHLDAIARVRPLESVRVWSRSPARADAFVEKARGKHRFQIESAATARAAVADADIVCTLTSSREPILQGEWLRAGQHVNAVGASVRTARELDSAAVARALVFVDRRESAEGESGDILMARAERGAHNVRIEGELGEVLLGRVPGRRCEADVTIFKSLGLAVEDVAAAHHIHGKAVAAGSTTSVELGRGPHRP